MSLLLKEEKRNRVLLIRWIKTIFFLITMLISLLMFSAPILVVIADALLPSALLSSAASWSPAASFSLESLSSNLRNYDFRFSLIDIPVISIVRSAIILCVYSSCDGPRLWRGPYLGIATICSVTSLIFVSLKASYVFGNNNSRSSSYDNGGHAWAPKMALFSCSLAMAIAHVVVAYRISCRERRKLLVYNIDIEAVTACKKGFSRYPKKLQEERVR